MYRKLPPLFLYVLFFCICFFPAPQAKARCLAEGFLNLELVGNENNGRINGWIGSEWIRWNVFYRRVEGNLGDTPVSLYLNVMPLSHALS